MCGQRWCTIPRVGGDRRRRCGREAPRVAAPRAITAVYESAPFRSAPIVVRVEETRRSPRARCGGSNPDLIPPRASLLSGAGSRSRFVHSVHARLHGACVRARTISQHRRAPRPRPSAPRERTSRTLKRSLSVIDRSRARDRRYAAAPIRGTIGDRRQRHIVGGVAHDRRSRECARGESCLSSSSNPGHPPSLSPLEETCEFSVTAGAAESSAIATRRT